MRLPAGTLSVDLARLGVFPIFVFVVLGGCRAPRTSVGPSIEFDRVPKADEGGAHTPLQAIEGRVVGGRPGQQIVLFARSGAWYVQPFVDQPFTSVRPDSTWGNSTHLGTEYAALLVEPGYQPPRRTEMLPSAGGAVLAVAAVKGEPPFWQTWWFRLCFVLACLLAVSMLHRFRLRQLSRQLHVRYEERLAERTRIAQELHDTLLQGFVSASMQLHVAVDQLPADSPARLPLGGVLELMKQVIQEGRNAVRGLRSSEGTLCDLDQAFSRIPQELGAQEKIDLRVTVEGRARRLHPVIRDEVYRIGREALVNAFRHSGAKSIEVELEFASRHLRVLIRDDGCGIDPHVLESGRAGHWGLSGMRERAERIGARLDVWSRAAAGTEVDLSVPGHVAFPIDPSDRRSGWLAGWSLRKAR